jgi:hypothetical protein
VKRALAVKPADLGRRDLALEEPDLAAAQPAGHEQGAGRADRGQRPHQVEDAEAGPEIAVHHRPVAGPTTGEDPPDRDDVAQVGRAAEERRRPSRQRVGPRDAVPDVEHRRRAAGRALGHQPRQQRPRRVTVAGARHHDPGPGQLADDRVDRARRHLQALALESQAHALGRPGIVVDHDDFARFAHDRRRVAGV